MVTDSPETVVTTRYHTIIPQVQFGSREDSTSQLVRLSASEGMLFLIVVVNIIRVLLCLF